jgi:site-specific recombinase XerD
MNSAPLPDLPTQPVTVRTSGAVDRLTATAEKAKQYAERARSTNTRRAYKADWNHFAAFCDSHGLTPLPAAPETLGLYLTELAETGYKAATLQRRLSAIREAHRIARHTLDTGHPAVREVWRGIRGVIGTAKTPKAAAVGANILAMLATLGDTTAGRRDRALLLLGFASALRRSELVGLDVGPGQTPGDPAGHGWIEFCDEGIRVRLARSKTDQQGEGRSVGVPFGVHPDTCPVSAVRAWLDHAGIVHGPLFRPVGRAGTIRLDRLTDRSVALIVKRAAEAAGLDPATYAGHSLRSGHATTVAMNDGDERTIQAQLGHASAEMTRRYIREANIFRRSSAGKLGL